MRYLNNSNRLIILAFMIAFSTGSFAQEKNFSQIVVHIWGEVKLPGEYRVSDGTDVLGIISKAGGPTEFSRLSKVRLTRTLGDLIASPSGSYLSSDGKQLQFKPGTNGTRFGQRQRVTELDVNKYLKRDQKVEPLPMLQSGDIVYIPRNRWSTWRTVASIIRDVAIVANAYYFVRLAN